MADNIIKMLQGADGPSDDLDDEITVRIGRGGRWTEDYTGSLQYFESRGFDWLAGNVNGHLGGTPWGCVGVAEDRASYSGTALLSLWLSFFRLELGDERKEQAESVADTKKPFADVPPWEPRQGFAAGFRTEDGFRLYAGILATIEEIEGYEPYFEAGKDRQRCFIIYYDGEGGEHIIAEWDGSKWGASDGA